jgi:hypothetical protein
MAIKLNTFCDIISTTPVKDAEGFATKGDTVLASVRAERESMGATSKWEKILSNAAFAGVTEIFRFRKIPGVTVDASMVIVCDVGRFGIVSVDDIKGRGLYAEVLAKKVEGSA